MRLPLFAVLAYAKSHPLVPKEFRHSGILSLGWMQSQERALHLSYYQPMDGVQCIDAVVRRIFRDKPPVRSFHIAEVRAAVAATIYEHSTQQTLYERRHVQTLQSGCFSRIKGETYEGMESLIWTRGEPCRYMQAIPIKPVPRMLCKWCKSSVFPKESWLQKRSDVRCNKPVCRHMDHLEHQSQSSGGIDLTPTQRKRVSRDRWAEMRIVNYLLKASNDHKQRERNQGRGTQQRGPSRRAV